MNRAVVFIGIFFFLLIAGCVSAPKQKFIVAHDPIMDQGGGVVLIADVCIKEDVVGDNDYFVIAEAKEGAKALLGAARSYLEENQVKVRSELVPFVCGSLSHDKKDAVLKVADHIGEKAIEAKPPFGIAPEIGKDPDLLDALGKMAADSFERSMKQKLKAITKQVNKTEPESSPSKVKPEELQSAIKLIAEKMNATSVLYLGVNGTSISTGKAFAQGLLDFSVGVLTGVATGLATRGASSLIFMPGHSEDWRFTSGCLINLGSGECPWTGWVSGPGDPMKAKVVADAYTLNNMLFDLVHKPDPNEPAKVE